MTAAIESALSWAFMAGPASGRKAASTEAIAEVFMSIQVFLPI